MRSWGIFLLALNISFILTQGFRRVLNKFAMSSTPSQEADHPPTTTTMFATATRKALQIGLTGSIGMGKSAVAGHFRALGFKVFDADAAVHELYAAGGAGVEPIRKAFPEAVVDDAVFRPNLAKIVVGNATALKELEEIVHPLVAAERVGFYEEANANGDFLVVYDVPLLLENRANHDVDYVVVATADEETQKERVMQRPGMTEEKFLSLLAKQMPDAEKRSLADYLVKTNYPGYAPAKAQVAQLVTSIIQNKPEEWCSWRTRNQLSAGTTTAAATVNQLGKEKQKQSLKDVIDMVVFDLDDTLVPVLSPIKPAIDALFAFMDDKMPLTAESARANIRSEMNRMSEENPLLAHDLTELRKTALISLSTPFGEAQFVEEAMKIFVALRSEVAPHLYDDVVPCLEWLTKVQGVQVAVLTNGNANLTTCPILGQYVSTSISAGEVGAMKPSPIPFISISQRTQIVPRRILFVGDSYTNDVVGAASVGMYSVLLSRPAEGGNEDKETEKTATEGNEGKFAHMRAQEPSEIAEKICNVELNSLHPSEFGPKTIQFLCP